MKKAAIIAVMVGIVSGFGLSASAQETVCIDSCLAASLDNPTCGQLEYCLADCLGSDYHGAGECEFSDPQSSKTLEQVAACSKECVANLKQGVTTDDARRCVSGCLGDPDVEGELVFCGLSERCSDGEECPVLPESIVVRDLSIPSFVGYTEKSDKRGESLNNRPVQIRSLAEFRLLFGGEAQLDVLCQQLSRDPVTNSTPPSE